MVELSNMNSRMNLLGEGGCSYSTMYLRISLTAGGWKCPRSQLAAMPMYLRGMPMCCRDTPVESCHCCTITERAYTVTGSFLLVCWLSIMGGGRGIEGQRPDWQAEIGCTCGCHSQGHHWLPLSDCWMLLGLLWSLICLLSSLCLLEVVISSCWMSTGNWPVAPFLCQQMTTTATVTLKIGPQVWRTHECKI